MKDMQRFSLATILIGGIGIVVFLAMLFHMMAISQQLLQSKSEIRSLQDQITTLEKQRCQQTYTWKSNIHHRQSIDSSGGARTYTVHTPASYTANHRYPVIIAFDGLNGSAKRAELLSGFNTLPALIIYPDALLGKYGTTAWQGAPYSPKGVSDVQFVDDLLTQVEKDFCIDTEKIYTIGMSNGAGVALLAACELKGRIAGTVGISGAYYTSCPRDASPPPKLLFIHSMDDGVIPFSGNNFRKLPNIYELALSYSRKASCQRITIDKGNAIEQFQWHDCRGNSRVGLLITHQQPHGWLHAADISLVPDGALVRRTTSAVIWDFLTAPY